MLPQGLPRRVLGALVIVVTALGLVALTPGRALAGPNEGDFFSAVNAARAANGVHSLVYAADLAAVARRQAERMGRAGELFHNPDLGGEVAGWQIVSENIGYGPTWSGIQQALMASPDHRANLLDREVTQLGVGTYVDGEGRMWVSQVFRLPYGATAPSGGSSGSGSGSASAAPDGSSGTGALPAVVAPSPEQQLRDRLATARDKVTERPAAKADPLTDALDFSTVMATVGR